MDLEFQSFFYFDCNRQDGCESLDVTIGVETEVPSERRSLRLYLDL